MVSEVFAFACAGAVVACVIAVVTEVFGVPLEFAVNGATIAVVIGTSVKEIWCRNR